MIKFLIERFKESSNKPAIIWNDSIITYADLLNKYNDAKNFISQNSILPGKVVALNGDFTPNAIAVLIALIDNKNIVVPFNSPIKESEHIKFTIAEVEYEILVDIEKDTYGFVVHENKATHPFYEVIRERQAPGLVLFTSGTSGFPKGAVHDFDKLLKKFITTRKSLRTVNFLLFDHWGGLNTLFHTLSNCGVVLALRTRKPDAVCEFVDKYQIELLPVSPSFLNLLILSETYRKFKLDTLKVITYGTEPMPENTLKRAKEIFPHAIFQQTYGLIELGVLRAKSKSDDSLWVKLGGEGYDLRVVDNILQIKAESAMLGYLNAPSPFTDDGYFITGDEVEVDSEYYKILGRKSEIINVGGDKVYPQEVENIILGMDNVLEATVYGEKHVMMGNIVCAKIALAQPAEHKEFIREVKKYCKERLQPFKIPVKILIEEGPLYTDRFKKKRKFE
ncbi:MAG: long-chain fatty acid--CoA ligase [Bacteroidota bacterium]